MEKHDAPYVVDGILDISGLNGVEINIHPGTEFHFYLALILRWKRNPGTLIARGSDKSPIIFDSMIRMSTGVLMKTGLLAV